MPIDPSILLSGQGVKLPDPLALATQGLTFADMRDRAALMKYTLARQRRQDEMTDAADAARAAVLRGGYSNDSLLAADPRALPILMKEQSDFQKNQADVEEKRAKAANERGQERDRKLKLIGGSAWELANNPNLDQATVLNALRVWQSQGVDLNSLGQPRDLTPDGLREYMKSVANLSVGAPDRIKFAGEEAQRTETNRHNKRIEDLTADRDRETAKYHQDRLAQGNQGTWQPMGVDPASGQPVWYNNRNPVPVLSKPGVGPGGKTTVTPFSGMPMDQTTWSKQVEELGTTMGNARRTEQLINIVQQNPRAFGDVPALAAYIPNAFIVNKINEASLNPEERRARSRVMREASMEVNKLYGAALSLGEQARAQQFIPGQNDDLPTVLAKLQAAREWAASKEMEYPEGVVNAAAARMKKPGGTASQSPRVVDIGGGMTAERE